MHVGEVAIQPSPKRAKYEQSDSPGRVKRAVATPIGNHACPSAHATLASLLLSGSGAPLDFGGRLAELLWDEAQGGIANPDVLRPRRRRVGSDFTPLLAASRDIQLGTIVGIKECRFFVFGASGKDADKRPSDQGFWHRSVRYNAMCDLIRIALPEQWKNSRNLRLHKSEDADYNFAVSFIQGLL